MVGEGDQIMVFKQCIYKCNTMIEVRNTPEGFRPFEQSGTMHDCPNSEYNKKKQQGESYRTPKSSLLTDFEEKSLTNDEEIKTMLRTLLSGRSFIEPEEPEE